MEKIMIGLLIALIVLIVALVGILFSLLYVMVGVCKITKNFKGKDCKQCKAN